MAVNPYLETGVRLQQDRGQFAITTGPYRFVRHPMYVGVIINQFATPLVLGSM
jgi:protein-S-isoprenylcysteine O-methyltransferase Ste14